MTSIMTTRENDTNTTFTPTRQYKFRPPELPGMAQWHALSSCVVVRVCQIIQCFIGYAIKLSEDVFVVCSIAYEIRHTLIKPAQVYKTCDYVVYIHIRNSPALRLIGLPPPAVSSWRTTQATVNSTMRAYLRWKIKLYVDGLPSAHTYEHFENWCGPATLHRGCVQ